MAAPDLAEPTRTRAAALPPPLAALALAAFAIGTTDFVIMGLLPQVAGSLHVSIPTAGWLVSGYALGVFIGAPIMAVATARLPHRAALMALMGIFILGNGLCAVAPSYGFLMAARIVTSLCHGAFFGIGAVEAASLVPAEKRASAVALMFTGLTLANVLGVPAGTALGQALGWRATFWAVTAIGAAALAGLAALLPHDPHHAPPPIRREIASLGPPAWTALGITVIGSSAMFTLFTYIAPVLNLVTGIGPRGVTYTLFVAGVGLTIGNILGGRLADRRLGATLAGAFLGIAGTLFLFRAFGGYVAAAEVILFAWAIATFAAAPGLQINVVRAAPGAPNLISTLNIGAFNAGNALGAWVGGQVIARGLGYAAIAPVAGVLALAAAGLTLYAFRPASRAASPS